MQPGHLRQKKIDHLTSKIRRRKSRGESPIGGKIWLLYPNRWPLYK